MLYKIKNYRRIMFVVIGIIYFLVCVHRLSPTVMARDLAVSFNADAVTLGIISSAYFYLYASMQPVVGYFSDTIGPRRVMTFFFIIAALGSGIFALAPNASTATLGRALVGAGSGGVFIPSLKLFSRWYRSSEFAGLTGIMLAIGGLAGISATLPLTHLVLWAGWRETFMAITLLSIVMTAFCWKIVRDAPHEKGWNSELVKEQGFVRDMIDFAPGDEGIIRRLYLIVSDFNFRMITVATFFTAGSFLTFQGLWGVPYLMDVFGLDRVNAGRVLMLFPVGFALGGLIVGKINNRLRSSRKKVLLLLILLQIFGWSMLFLCGSHIPVAVSAIIFFIFGFAAGGSMPLSFNVVRNLFSDRLIGTAVGLMNISPFLGAGLYQPLTGYFLRNSHGPLPGSYAIDAYMNLMVLFILSVTASFIAVLSIRKGFS